MKLKAKRLTAQQAVKLWAEFYVAYGAEQMNASYAWTRPPVTVSTSEKVFEFLDESSNRVGWGSYVLNTRDAEDDEARLSVGVYPKYQRLGYHSTILVELSERAAKKGADYASQVVLKSNAAHYARTRRNAENGPWVYSGDGWFPAPGFGYFIYPLSDTVKKAAEEYRCTISQPQLSGPSSSGRSIEYSIGSQRS